MKKKSPDGIKIKSKEDIEKSLALDRSIKNQKVRKLQPVISQYTPQIGELERMEQIKLDVKKPFNKAASSKIAKNAMDNIVEPILWQAGAEVLPIIGKFINKELPKPNILSQPKITRGPIDWANEPGFIKRNPGLSGRDYENWYGAEHLNRFKNGGNMTKKQANNSSLILDYGKSGIHIKPENKGKFTATKKATGKSTEELTHSKNPLTKKRAIFAQNAKKWNHGEEGIKIKNNISTSVPQAYQGFFKQDFNSALNKDDLNSPDINKGNFDIGKTIAASLMGINALMPQEQIKMNGVSSATMPYYNPNPSGTNTSAIMEDGGDVMPLIGDTTGTALAKKESDRAAYLASINAFMRKPKAEQLKEIEAHKKYADSVANTFNRQQWVEQVNNTGYEPLKIKNKTNKTVAKNLAMGGGLPGASGMFYARSNDSSKGTDFQPKSMRMGGHFKPEEQWAFGGKMSSAYEQGGELQLYSPDSEAAHLSESIIKFNGAEHGEKNAIGSEGIPLQYGGNPVEVENDETGYSTQDGGFTVLGKMTNPLTGRMFKNDGKALAKKEVRVSKQMTKGNILMDESDIQNPFELLKFNSGKAKTIGAKAKEQQITQEKEILAALQQHMLDFAEINNLDPNAMSKGKMKTAKYGIKIPKAYNGIEIEDPTLPAFVGKPVRAARTGYEDYTNPSFTQREHDLYKVGKSIGDIMSGKYTSVSQPTGVTFDDVSPIAPIKNDVMFKGADWKNYIKPGYVLATNKTQPVRAQMYNPRLEQTYQSEADLNPIIANNRATQLALSGNAAEAATATALGNQQIYSAQGQGFAQNQDRAVGVYNRNNATINDAELKNLGIADQQYTRQTQADANTRRMTTDALGQIGEIDLQNKRDWNNFNVQKQLFPTYGVDNNYQLNVTNPYQFNIPEGYTSIGKDMFINPKGEKYKVKKTTDGRNQLVKTEKTTEKGKYGISITREFKSYKP